MNHLIQVRPNQEYLSVKTPEIKFANSKEQAVSERSFANWRSRRGNQEWLRRSSFPRKRQELKMMLLRTLTCLSQYNRILLKINQISIKKMVNKFNPQTKNPSWSLWKKALMLSSQLSPRSNKRSRTASLREFSLDINSRTLFLSRKRSSLRMELAKLCLDLKFNWAKSHWSLGRKSWSRQVIANSLSKTMALKSTKIWSQTFLIPT